MLATQPEILQEAVVTRRTLIGFFEKLNAFRSASSVGGGLARGINFLSTQNNNTGENKNNSSGQVRDMITQTAWIELLYGLLGILLILGVFGFAYFGGRVQQTGWKSVINDHLSGKKLQHFFAFVLSLIGGSFAVSQLNSANDRSDILYVASVIIMLSYYLSIDDASKLPGAVGRLFQESDLPSGTPDSSRHERINHRNEPIEIDLVHSLHSAQHTQGALPAASTMIDIPEISSPHFSI